MKKNSTDKRSLWVLNCLDSHHDDIVRELKSTNTEVENYF